MRKPKNVLLVDDSSLVCWGLTKILSDASFHVTTVNNGESALNEISNIPYCLVFLDIHLPDLNGLEVLGEIKKAAPEAKVVIMSTYGSEYIRRLAQEKGASHIIEKPFTFSEIRNVISKMFAGDIEQPQSAFRSRDLRRTLRAPFQ